MSDPTISDEPMVDPEVATITYAEVSAETMNIYYAEEGIAYPVSGDHLANWDGHGMKRKVSRDFAKGAAAMKQAWAKITADFMRDFMPAFRKFQALMIDTDPKMQARIRNGHPATPRKQLLHNGRKP